jgi:hypothetical protein
MDLKMDKKSALIIFFFALFATAFAAAIILRNNFFGTKTVRIISEHVWEIITEPKIEEEPQVSGAEEISASNQVKPYPVHKNITSTFFWVGEKASDDNAGIANSDSAWDDDWKDHFGGSDNPKKRNGFQPQGFEPRENPFYVALPYNDFDSNGKRKKEVWQLMSWAGEKQWKEKESLCKNRWVKLAANNKTVYAQWEDVGPFQENDYKYVFQNGKPKNKENKNAGIDVSPAVRNYLELKDIDKVDWQFVDDNDVPDGEWKKIVTVSQVYWR